MLFFVNCVYWRILGEPVNFRVELGTNENFAELGSLLRRFCVVSDVYLAGVIVWLD